MHLLLYVTIVILFGYTIILMLFFMGWCTMIPNRCHPRREIPFSSVKSPRRNTKFIEIDSVSSSTSIDMYKSMPQRLSLKTGGKKLSLNIPSQPQHLDDYLHPKYSLPPLPIDILQRRFEFEQLLRTPGRSVRMGALPKQHSLDIPRSVHIEM